MFHNIPSVIQDRMKELEAQDERDRNDGTGLFQRLRQVPPETGRFLALMCMSAPVGTVLEVGASGGYSGLWITRACELREDWLTTFEILPEKARLAEETFQMTGVSHLVKLIQGDARELAGQYRDVAFCFLDAEKDVYLDCYEKIVPNMIQGGLLLADNIISHEADLRPFTDRALSDPRVDALVVPIGKGVLVCRKI